MPQSLLPTPKPRSTAQSVYDLIRSDIVSGVMRPGAAIREAELCAQLGISRTPVREALLRLASLGLVDIQPQSATRVAPLRPEKLSAVHLIIEAVEAKAVKRACSAASGEQLAGLTHVIEDLAVALRRADRERFFELDGEFRRELFEAAGLVAIAAELDGIRVHLDRLRQTASDWREIARKSLNDATTLLDALRQRDESKAVAAIGEQSRAMLRMIEGLAAG